MNAKSKAVKILDLEAHAGYRGAVEKLKKLDLALADAEGQVERFKFRANRASEEGRRYISRVSGALCSDESALELVVRRIVSTGNISPELLAAGCAGVQKPPEMLDRYDRELITEILEVNAAKELLSKAVALQRREVARQKNLAAGEICDATQADREQIAHVIADAFMLLSKALLAEAEFHRKFRDCDIPVPALLSPPPFPLKVIPPDPEVWLWIVKVLNLSEAEAEHLLAPFGESPSEVA